MLEDRGEGWRDLHQSREVSRPGSHRKVIRQAGAAHLRLETMKSEGDPCTPIVCFSLENWV